MMKQSIWDILNFGRPKWWWMGRRTCLFQECGVNFCGFFKVSSSLGCLFACIVELVEMKYQKVPDLMVETRDSWGVSEIPCILPLKIWIRDSFINHLTTTTQPPNQAFLKNWSIPVSCPVRHIVTACCCVLASGYLLRNVQTESSVAHLCEDPGPKGSKGSPWWHGNVMEMWWIQTQTQTKGFYD